MSAESTVSDICEGTLDVFLGEPVFETTQLYEPSASLPNGDRFPNVVVTKKGTVLAVWGERAVRVRRSEDGGQTWSAEIEVTSYGIHSGGATVDEETGACLLYTSPSPRDRG
eukprot:636772-Amphidinium_carterae.2